VISASGAIVDDNLIYADGEAAAHSQTAIQIGGGPYYIEKAPEVARNSIISKYLGKGINIAEGSIITGAHIFDNTLDLPGIGILVPRNAINTVLGCNYHTGNATNLAISDKSAVSNCVQRPKSTSSSPITGRKR
jgi:hypothetical protein